MNLFFLAVCNVLIITSSIGIPRSRHRHKKFPVTRPQNYKDQTENFTALEVLEQTLLQPDDRRFAKKASDKFELLRNRRKRRLMRNCSTPRPSSSALDLVRCNSSFNFGRCQASFGNKSPLCKTKHKVKSKRSFESKDMCWDAVTNPNLVESTFYDFFSLFITTNSPSTVSESSSTNNTSKKETSINSKSTLSSAKTSIATTPLSSSYTSIATKPNLILDKVVSSFESPKISKKMARTVVLPANPSKIESESKLLYLEPPENPTLDIRSFYKQNDEEGDGPQENLDSHSQEGTTGDILNLFSTSQHVEHEGFESASEAPGSDNLNAMPSSNERTAITSSSDKIKCETQYNKKCVCSFAALKPEFQSTFSKTINPKSALEKVKALHCRTYAPVIDKFEISSQSKPKDIEKEKKAVAVSEEKGPKEIEQSSLDEFIAQTSSADEGDVINVFAGADVKVPCFPTGGIHLSSSEPENVHYKWTHENKKPITEGNTKENCDGEGTLAFDDINIADSDNYTCDVEYINPDTGHFKKEAFKHSVSVVSLPILTVHVLVHYGSEECGKGLTDTFRKYLPSQVEQLICDIGENKHLCTVDVHNAVCVDSSGEAQTHERTERKADPVELDHAESSSLGKREKRQASKEISLNYEVHVHKRDEQLLTSGNKTLCDPNCHLVINFKLMQLFRESMYEVVRIPVSFAMNNISGVFNPITSSVKIKYVFGCQAGDHYKGQGFCVACPKNTFSEAGAIVCTKCPAHTYQSGMGASKCVPCTTAWIPACNEYIEDLNKSVVVVVVVLVLLVLVAIVLWLCFGSRERREANVKKLVVGASLKNRSKKVKFGKTQKSLRRKLPTKQESSELQTFLNSSQGEGDSSATEDQR